jgi:hypothetical protein
VPAVRAGRRLTCCTKASDVVVTARLMRAV